MRYTGIVIASKRLKPTRMKYFKFIFVNSFLIQQVEGNTIKSLKLTLIIKSLKCHNMKVIYEKFSIILENSILEVEITLINNLL